MDNKIGSVVFDDWVVISKIGSGANGMVYCIEKENQDVPFRSALKVIRVLQDETLQQKLLSEGMIENQVTA